MSFSFTNQHCRLEDCINGPEGHLAIDTCAENPNDDSSLKLDSEDEEILNNPKFLHASSHFYGQENPKTEMEDLIHQDPVSYNPKNYENLLVNEPVESYDSPEPGTSQGYNPNKGEDINKAINSFYKYWSLPDNQEVIYKTPIAVFDSILKDPRFNSYKDMFGSCRLKFYQLGCERGRDLMIHFISERNIRYFQNFDILLFGATIIHHTANQKDLDQLKIEFESKVSFLVDSVKTVEEHIKTIDSSHEALRDTINCVSEAAHGLSAAKRSLELQRERDPSHAPEYPNISKEPLAMSSMGPKPKIVYRKEHLAIPIGVNNELLFSLVTQYNKGLTSADLVLFGGLSKMKEEVFLRALTIPWSILLKWISSLADSSPVATARVLVSLIMNVRPLPEKIKI